MYMCTYQYQLSCVIGARLLRGERIGMTTRAKSGCTHKPCPRERLRYYKTAPLQHPAATLPPTSCGTGQESGTTQTMWAHRPRPL